MGIRDLGTIKKKSLELEKPIKWTFPRIPIAMEPSHIFSKNKRWTPDQDWEMHKQNLTIGWAYHQLSSQDWWITQPQSCLGYQDQLIPNTVGASFFTQKISELSKKWRDKLYLDFLFKNVKPIDSCSSGTGNCSSIFQAIRSDNLSKRSNI